MAATRLVTSLGRGWKATFEKAVPLIEMPDLNIPDFRFQDQTYIRK
jgi:hypothetical protein